MGKRYHGLRGPPGVPRHDRAALQLRGDEGVLSQIYKRAHGPRPGKQPTVHQQPTAQEPAQLGQVYEAWATLIPMGKACSVRWLMEQQKKNLRRGPYQQLPSFAGALREVYPQEYVEGRYRRYFQAFFQVDGDTARQRLSARPEGIAEPSGPRPGEPGGISAAVIVEFWKLGQCPCLVVHKDSKVY